MTRLLLLLIAVRLNGFDGLRYRDAVSGFEVVELTADPLTASNLYYHVPNFTADGRYVILAATNGGPAQVYRYEVGTGRLTRLTDDPKTAAHSASPDPRNPGRVFYFQDARLMAVDVETGRSRLVGVIPEPHRGGFQQPTMSHDGRHLIVTKRRDNYNWEIGAMDIATGVYRTVITQGFPIGHVQHSPTDPLIFYVWETGGYAPQRSWVVNADGSANRPFYYRVDAKTWFTTLKEWVTHEAWVQKTGDMTMINDKVGVMLVARDGSSRMLIEGKYWHGSASPDGKRMVLDDFDGRLWLLDVATGNRRLLATGLRDKFRDVHPHPSFDWSGKYVLFNTGRTHRTVAMIAVE